MLLAKGYAATRHHLARRRRGWWRWRRRAIEDVGSSDTPGARAYPTTAEPRSFSGPGLHGQRDFPRARPSRPSVAPVRRARPSGAANPCPIPPLAVLSNSPIGGQVLSCPSKPLRQPRGRKSVSPPGATEPVAPRHGLGLLVPRLDIAHRRQSKEPNLIERTARPGFRGPPVSSAGQVAGRLWAGQVAARLCAGPGRWAVVRGPRSPGGRGRDRGSERRLDGRSAARYPIRRWNLQRW